MNNYESVKYKEALRILDLKEGFTYQELHNKKRSLLSLNHPDKHPGEEEKYTKISEEINGAFYYLKEQFDTKKKEEEEKESNIFKADFIRDIKSISFKYNKNKKILNLCNVYLKRLENIKTIEELKNQKDEFNKKMKILKDGILLDNEKNKFRTKLNYLKNNSDISIDEKKIAILFLEKLEVVYDINTLRKLEQEFEEEIENLRQRIKKEHLELEKKIFLEKIEKLDKEGIPKETIQEYKEKVLKAKDIIELNNLNLKLSFEIKKIKEYREKVTRIKKILLNEVENSYENFQNEEYKKILDNYKAIITEEENLNELEKISVELKNEIKSFFQKEKQEHEQYIVLKDKVKRACIYNFYRSTINHSIKRILNSIKILEKVLLILSISEKENFNDIIDILMNIDYKNLELDESKLDFFRLTKEGKIIIKNENELASILKRTNIDYDGLLDDDFNDIKERREIKQKIMIAQYNYATNNNYEEIKESINLLVKVLSRLDEINDLELLENYNIYEQVDFKDLNKTRKIIKDLSFSNKLYLRLKTGDICTLQNMSDGILVIPVSNDKGVDILSKDIIEKEFITMREFFEKATFTNGHEVLERLNRYDTSRVFYTFERKPLYYYRNLILDYYEPTYSNPVGYFEFTSSSSSFGWKAGELKKDMGNCRMFINRELCEKKLVEQVKKQIETEKEREETIDF